MILSWLRYAVEFHIERNEKCHSFDIPVESVNYTVRRMPGLSGFQLVIARVTEERSATLLCTQDSGWHILTGGNEWEPVVHGCQIIDLILMRYVNDLTQYAAQTHDQAVYYNRL